MKPAARRPGRSPALAFMLAAASFAASAQPASPGQASVGAAEAPAAPTYVLDPTHTFVHWEIVHMGTSTIRGRFGKVSGNVAFGAKAQQLDLGIVVETASVDSGVSILDNLIRGSAMLDAAAQPQAFFVARGARFEGEVPREVRGEFTLRGISQPLTLRALRWKCGLNPLFRREVCGGDFEGEIVRSTFGITHSLPFVADRVRLVVQVEGIAQP